MLILIELLCILLGPSHTTGLILYVTLFSVRHSNQKSVLMHSNFLSVLFHSFLQKKGSNINDSFLAKQSAVLMTLLVLTSVSSQELEIWFLSHVWCQAPMRQYAISSKWLPKIFIQMFKKYLWTRLQVPVVSCLKPVAAPFFVIHVILTFRQFRIGIFKGSSWQYFDY